MRIDFIEAGREQLKMATFKSQREEFLRGESKKKKEREDEKSLGIYGKIKP